jgi:hypothetical protein
MKIELTAYWGDGCAISTIKVSPKLLEQIKQGGKYYKSTWGYYDGQRFRVSWTFENGLYSIDGEDAMQCVVEEAIDELVAD